MTHREIKAVVAAIIGLNIFLLVFAISVRWEAQSMYLNMDMIGVNFLGLFLGFVVGVWIAEQKASEKLIQEREKWVDKNGELLREIENLKSMGEK